ncbi:hypothetical protein AtubIFM56815_008650 [Aspergillus tubingensis]|uniref:Uncharacterized protein n=1 Tax=Aspergillus tubingensis TaxID=5068 RepID=A0A9W6AMY1_ASPTU|nr:hypothetical protein AtubIFM54640_007475 [Aspergillus tubingensis]GLA84437.1 hypothetical protein AtubIFM56815_008650 [Aspergillus tubingensis]
MAPDYQERPDTNPENEYRCSSYVSVTGGGSGDMLLMFFTDVKENRQHRAAFGEFLRTWADYCKDA